MEQFFPEVRLLHEAPPLAGVEEGPPEGAGDGVDQRAVRAEGVRA